MLIDYMSRKESPEKRHIPRRRRIYLEAHRQLSDVWYNVVQEHYDKAWHVLGLVLGGLEINKGATDMKIIGGGSNIIIEIEYRGGYNVTHVQDLDVIFHVFTESLLENLYTPIEASVLGHLWREGRLGRRLVNEEGLEILKEALEMVFSDFEVFKTEVDTIMVIVRDFGFGKQFHREDTIRHVLHTIFMHW